MLNLKQLVIIFFVGFLLSFFAGLVGNVSFGTLCLRALLSGGLFLTLAYVAVTVYNKFLVPEEAIESKPDENTSTETSPHTVDVIIDDDLPDSATAPSFNLSNFVQTPSSDEDGDTEEISEVTSIPPTEFQSSSLDSMTRNAVEEPQVMDGGESTLKSQESESIAAAHHNVVSNNIAETLLDDGGSSELGVLPDIEALGIEEDIEDASAADDLIQDSVFAETGEVKPVLPTAAPSEMGDAKEIAAAIRTALVKDT